MIKKFKNLFSILFIGVLTLGMFVSFSMVHSDDTIERIVAKVNDGIISLSELEEYVKGYVKQGLIQNTYKERLEVLKLLIENELVNQIARKYNIITLSTEVEQKINVVLAQNGIESQEEFEKLIIANNIAPSLYAYKKELEKSITLEKLAYNMLEAGSSEISIKKPTSDEIRDFYEQRIGEFRLSGERRIRHIVLSAGTTGSEYRKSNKQASEIKEKIESGEATFDDMAKQYSIDNDTKDQGGDLGSFTKEMLNGVYPYYTESVFFAEKGELLVIVTTSEVIVLQVTDIKEGRTRSFSEVYNMIRTMLFFENFQREFPNYLKEYREKSIIEILL